MFDRAAAGQYRGSGSAGGVRVNHRPQTYGRRLATGRANLVVRHGLRPTVADRRRRKQLDHVGAIGFRFPDERTDLLGSTGVGVNRP